MSVSLTPRYRTTRVCSHAGSVGRILTAGICVAAKGLLMPEPVPVYIQCPNCGELKCSCKYVVTCKACQAERTSALDTPEAAFDSFREHHESSHSAYMAVREKGGKRSPGSSSPARGMPKGLNKRRGGPPGGSFPRPPAPARSPLRR